eukprot:c25875_g1_i1 orf=385-792(-)
MGIEFHDWISRVFQTPQYSRLNKSSANKPQLRRKRLRVAKLRSKRKSWRLKLFPKLRFLRFSLFTFLSKLRDAYVNMMLSISSNLYSPELVIGNFAVCHTSKPFGELALKEYEKRYLVELCKAANRVDLAVIARS